MSGGLRLLRSGPVGLRACVALLSAAAVSCDAGEYRPGSLTPADTRSAGCLDVAASLSRVPDTLGSVVVSYRVGNRCSHRATVDLGAARVFAQTPGALEPWPLEVYDPSREIEPVTINAEGSGGDSVRYDSTRGEIPEDALVCVDLAELDHARGRSAEPVCRRFGDIPIVGLFYAPDSVAADENDCTETSPVIGYRGCTRFGWWRAFAAALTIEGGLSVHAVHTGGALFTGSTDANVPYTVHGGLLGQYAPAILGDLRGRWFLAGPLFVGAELGIGGLAVANVADPAGDAQTTDTAIVLEGGALVGASLLRRGRFETHVEALAGGRAVSLPLVKPPVSACSSGDSPGCAAMFGEGLIEARVGADFWVARFLSIGAWAGTNVLSFEPAGGLFVAVHTDAYDGR